jgi:hypothetical protein
VSRARRLDALLSGDRAPDKRANMPLSRTVSPPYERRLKCLNRRFFRDWPIEMSRYKNGGARFSGGDRTINYHMKRAKVEQAGYYVGLISGRLSRA